MRNLVLYLFLFYSFGSWAKVCAPVGDEWYENEIDAAKHIFIAEIKSVTVQKISADRRSKVFKIEFDVLESLKKLEPITFHTLIEKDYQSSFSPGFVYLILTDNGQIKTGCLSNNLELSGGYPNLFEHEDFHIKSVLNYLNHRTPIDKEEIFHLYEKYNEGCFG